MSAPPFLQSAGRGDLLFWGGELEEGPTVVIWESQSEQEKASSSMIHDWSSPFAKKGAARRRRLGEQVEVKMHVYKLRRKCKKCAADSRGAVWRGGGRYCGVQGSGKQALSDRKGCQNPSLAASFIMMIASIITLGEIM